MPDINSRALIIIPCLNEALYLDALVENLLLSSQPYIEKIIIADGGSNDGTVDIAKNLAQKHHNVLYMHNPQKVQSAAINLAVSTYGHLAPFIIRIDAHSDYPSDYCRILIQEAIETNADSVVTAMHTKGTTTFQKAVAAAQNSIIGNGGSLHRTVSNQGRWVDHGHHALWKVTAFNKVGGYDETFAYNEDAELDYRLTSSGHKIWLTGKTSLAYYPRSTPEALFRQYLGYGHGRVQTILKHKIRPKLRQLIPASVFPLLLLSLLSPLYSLALAPAASLILICTVYGLVAAHKTRNPPLVLMGPAALIMHTAWSLGFWRGLLEKIRA